MNLVGVIDEAVIGDKYRLLVGGLDERGMRRWVAAEALSLGRGGTAAVARATGSPNRRSGAGALSWPARSGRRRAEYAARERVESR